MPNSKAQRRLPIVSVQLHVAAPARALDLLAVLERDAADDERDEHEQRARGRSAENIVAYHAGRPRTWRRPRR